MENISKAIMLIWENLQDDHESNQLLERLDMASNDDEVKLGIVEGVGRLRVLGKRETANAVEALTKGFAF